MIKCNCDINFKNGKSGIICDYELIKIVFGVLTANI